MRIRLILIFLFLSFHYEFVFAGAIEQIKKFSLEVKSAKGQFVQVVKKGESQTRSQKSNGDFLFAKPGRFIWTYVQPYQQTLSSNGESLYFFDKDLNQVVVRKMSDAMSGTPVALLFGNTSIEKNFTLKDLDSKDGVEWLEAIPIKKDQSFERVLIGFKDKVLFTMELFDPLGQTTTIIFSHLEWNPAIKPELFNFDIPAGVDVLRQ